MPNPRYHLRDHVEWTRPDGEVVVRGRINYVGRVAPFAYGVTPDDDPNTDLGLPERVLRPAPESNS